MEDAEIEEMIELRSSTLRAFEELSDSKKTASGVYVSPETALQCTAVLACVRVLAETIASLPLNLYRRLDTGGKVIASGMPLHNILSEQPNGWMTGFEFRELMQSWILLWGNAYAEIKPGQYGSVTELWPLHPSRMKIERLPNGRLRYNYTEPGKSIPTSYSQEQIFHLRWLTQDGVTGYIPTSLSKDAIGLARATELHTGAYFGNGARPGIILESDQPLKPETAQRLRQTWDEMHRGPDRGSKTAVLPQGIKAKELSGSNESSQLLETRRHQLEEIARVFRVPGYMIGDVTKTSYNSAEQQGLDFVTFSLVPWLRRWESAIRRDLVMDDENYFAEFDVRGLMRGDNAGRAQYYRELWNLGVLSINEIRIAESMNPIENGDKRFVQVNMALLESFVVETPPPAATPAAEVAPAETAPAPAASEEAAPAAATEGMDSTEPTAQEPPAPSTDTVAREVVFKTTLRKLAQVEIDGILERRNKPPKMAAWLEAHEKRMREELRESAHATGRHIDDFVVNWMNKSRDLLLECHRSGAKYETVAESWCDKHLDDNANPS